VEGVEGEEDLIKREVVEEVAAILKRY